MSTYYMPNEEQDAGDMVLRHTIPTLMTLKESLALSFLPPCPHPIPLSAFAYLLPSPHF